MLCIQCNSNIFYEWNFEQKVTDSNNWKCKQINKSRLANDIPAAVHMTQQLKLYVSVCEWVSVLWWWLGMSLVGSCLWIYWIGNVKMFLVWGAAVWLVAFCFSFSFCWPHVCWIRERKFCLFSLLLAVQRSTTGCCLKNLFYSSFVHLFFLRLLFW